MRRVLLVEEGVLTMAVTYKGDWAVGIESDELTDFWINWIPGMHAEYAEISYALSFVARMASMFYGVELTKIEKMMNDRRSLFPEIYPVEMIRSFVLHMVESIGKYRQVDTFILLVDEVMRMEDFLASRFGVDNAGKTRLLVRTLLSEEMHFNGTALHVSLAISSTSLAPAEKVYDKSRVVTAIPLPSKLNTATIVTNIWDKENRFDEDIYGHMMKLIAATVNFEPRCVEIVNAYITRNRRPDAELREFVIDIYEDLIKSLGGEYNIVCPSDSVWSALIFRNRVRLGDPGLVDAIKHSLITNTLKVFHAVQELHPQSSLIMLRVAASPGANITDAAASDRGSIIRRTATTGRDRLIADAFGSGIDSIIKSISKSGREGDLRETCYYEWMKIRIVAAMCYKANGEHNSIMKLLGIRTGKIVPYPYRELFRAPLELYGKDTGEVQLSCKSYGDSNAIDQSTESNAIDQSTGNIDKARKEIKDVEVSESCPIVMVRSAEGESWDLCLKIFTGEGNKPMHVFIENKSRETLNTSVKDLATLQKDRNRDTVTSYDLHNYGLEYRHTKEMMESLDFVYIHFTANNIDSFTVVNAIEMGGTDSYRYLGQLRELYSAGHK